MGLKDIIAKGRTSATEAAIRHRHHIDQGIEKVGQAANSKTGGRYATHIRKGSDQARAGLDRLEPNPPQNHPDTDRPESGAPDPR